MISTILQGKSKKIKKDTKKNFDVFLNARNKFPYVLAHKVNIKNFKLLSKWDKLPRSGD